jgi:glycerol-3-phosphate acyltransferase PlsY
LLISRIVSLSSILAAVSLPFFVYFFREPDSALLQYLSIGIAVFIPLTHYSNIKRLIKGQEKQFSFRKDKKEA